MMPSIYPKSSTVGSMEVIDAYWRKRKQRIGKMLEDFQKTGWKTGGFTAQNCQSLRKRLYQDNHKYSQKINDLKRQANLSPTKDCVTHVDGRLSPPNKRYSVLPGINNGKRSSESDYSARGDYSDTDEMISYNEMAEETKYNDVLRRNGANVEYIRQYETHNNVVVLKNRQFNAQAKIGSLENFHHKPGGGDFEVIHRPVKLKAVKSKVGSLNNTKHVPQGGKKKVAHHTVNWKAESKIGSLDNIDHQPQGGGLSPIFHKSQKWKAQSKVGSLDNIDHVPSRSFRTLQDYMSPFRERLLKRPGVIWTEGYYQSALDVKYESNFSPRVPKHVKVTHTR